MWKIIHSLQIIMKMWSTIFSKRPHSDAHMNSRSINVPFHDFLPLYFKTVAESAQHWTVAWKELRASSAPLPQTFNRLQRGRAQLGYMAATVSKSPNHLEVLLAPVVVIYTLLTVASRPSVWDLKSVRGLNNCFVFHIKLSCNAVSSGSMCQLLHILACVSDTCARQACRR